MSDNDYKEMFLRNIGLITKEDQVVLQNSTIGIAGAGADGGLTAERIVRLGVTSIKLADPETFDLSNINRQFGSSVTNVGRNKAEVVAEELKRINPMLNVEVFDKGINVEDVLNFVQGCDIIIDEIEYTQPKISILLHNICRQNKIEVFSGLNLGYGINIYRFSPNGTTIDQMMGLDINSNDSDFNMESLVPNIPKYVDRGVVEKVLKGEMYIPAVSPSVGLLSGYLSFVILGALTNKWQIPAAPKYIHLDMLEMIFSETELKIVS